MAMKHQRKILFVLSLVESLRELTTCQKFCDESVDFYAFQVEISVEIFHKIIWEEERTCGEEKIAQKFRVQKILSGEIFSGKKKLYRKSLLWNFLKPTKKNLKNTRRWFVSAPNNLKSFFSGRFEALGMLK